MNPLKFRMAMDYLTRIKKVKPDLPEVFPASQAPIPPIREDVKLREAVNRFVTDNPRQQKAGGGMLVQPGFGGVRQGYREDVKKQKVGKYTIERKGPAGLLQPRDMIAEPLTSYEKIKLKKKFPKTKFNFKEYSNIGVSSYDNNYDSIRRYIFRGFVDTTKFKILPVSVQNEIKGQFPEVKKWDFKKYAYGVSPERIGEKERRLKGLPPKDNRALVRKIARFVDEPEEFRYKFRVGNADGFMLYSMDRAFLQGNENYKPIKQGGKVVGFMDRTKDGGGKKYYYNGYIVNNKLKPGEKIIKDHPDFKKVKKFHDVALRSKLSLDDTSDVFKQLFPKGFDTSKIKFNDLIQFVSNKASKRNIYNSIVKHHTTGVGTNPTKDLQILTSVFNKQADDIGALIKKGDFSRVQELKDKGIRIVVDGKAYGAPKETAEAGYQRILSNVIEDVKTFKQKDFKNLETFLASLGDGTCAVQFGPKKRDGGRIGYATGTASLNDCIASGTKNFNDGKFKTADQVQDAAKLLRGGRAVISGLMKYGIIPELAYVGLEAAGRTLLGEKPTNSLLKSIDTLTFGATDFTSGIEAEKFGKFSDQKLAVDKFRNSQTLVNSLQNKLKNLEDINNQGGEGYIGDLSSDIQMTQAQLQRAQKSLQENTVSSDIVQFIDRKGQEIADTQMAKSGYAQASLKDQMEGIPGIRDYTDTEPTRIFPSQPSQMDLNLNMFQPLPRDFMQLKTSDAENLSQYYKSQGEDVSAKDILAYRDELKQMPLSQQAQIYGDEQTYGTQGISAVPLNVDLTNYQPSNRFGSNPQQRPILYSKGRGTLAGGGIAKLAGVDSGPPPASGPNSQGLQGLMKRVKRI